MRRGVLVAAAALACLVGVGIATGGPHATGPSAKISAAVLRSADLNGAKVEDQGFTHDIVAKARYERDFEAVTYGRSRLLYVESTVILYPSPVDARLALAGTRWVFDPTKSSFESQVTSAFAERTGGMPSTFSIRQNKTLTLPGTEGTAFLLRLTTPIGRMDGGYVFLQTDRLVGMLTVASKPNASIAPADLAGIYGAFAKRLRTTAKQL